MGARRSRLRRRRPRLASGPPHSQAWQRAGKAALHLSLTRVTVEAYHCVLRFVPLSRSAMLSQLIWVMSNLLEVALLVRGVRGRLIHRYPFFYSYIFFVLLQSPLRLAFYRWHPPLYANIYWVTEFLGAAIGCGMDFSISGFI